MKKSGINARRALAGIALATTLVVSGCSTGSAPEAQRSQKEDAKNTSVIQDMQATHTWDLINGTPESTPDATQEP